MRLPFALLALSLASNAYAGGMGVMAMGDIRTQPVYYYDSAANNQQYKMTQMIPGFGAGIDLVLGDRDDRIVGVFRGYWLREAAEKDPANSSNLNPDDIVANWREEARDVGVAMVGLQIGIVGDPTKFQLTLNPSAGAGFITTDHTEYLSMEFGPGMTYNVGDRMQIHATAAYQMRVRKSIVHGAVAYAGVRYLFD